MAFKVAYLGWNYHGFAIQETTPNTIEVITSFMNILMNVTTTNMRFMFLSLESVVFTSEIELDTWVCEEIFNPPSQFSKLGTHVSYSFLCLFICTVQMWCVGSGLPSFFLFLYDCLRHIRSVLYKMLA